MADVGAYAKATMESQRLRLRPVREEELGLLEQWWNVAENMQLQTARLLPRPSGEYLEMIRGWHKNADPASVGFGVERLEDEEFLGSVVLFGASFAFPTATFAIQLRPDIMGKGYGTEATRLMINYGFSVLPLHRIELQVFAFNDRAQKVYRAAGFVQEGVRREAMFVDGRWHDEILMSVLRPEWEARRSAARDM